MSLIRKHGAVLQAWACLALVNDDHFCHYCYLLFAEKHRGFAFVEFELAEDAAAAIDNLASSRFLFFHQLNIYLRHYVVNLLDNYVPSVLLINIIFIVID